MDSLYTSPSPLTSILSSIDNIFVSSSQEKTIDVFIRQLGVNAKEMNEEDVKKLKVNFEFLIERWIDSFEREIFDGELLSELLGE